MSGCERFEPGTVHVSIHLNRSQINWVPALALMSIWTTQHETLFVMQLINLSEIILKTILKRPTEVIQDLLQPTVFRKYIWLRIKHVHSRLLSFITSLLSFRIHLTILIYQALHNNAQQITKCVHEWRHLFFDWFMQPIKSNYSCIYFLIIFRIKIIYACWLNVIQTKKVFCVSFIWIN